MATKDTVTNLLDVVTATIANGESLSAAVDLGGLRLFGISMPSAWTSAAMTFQASYDGGTTWANMYDTTGTEISFAVAASRYIAADPVTFAGIKNLKIRSGTSGTPVNQGQETPLYLVLRSV